MEGVEGVVGVDLDGILCFDCTMMFGVGIDVDNDTMIVGVVVGLSHIQVKKMTMMMTMPKVMLKVMPKVIPKEKRLPLTTNCTC